MLRKWARLFTIKNRFEAYAVIYALALGAVERGFHYMQQYPGAGGYLLFGACTGAVFLAGAKLLDSVRPRSHRRSSLNRVLARARVEWPRPAGTAEQRSR